MGEYTHSRPLRLFEICAGYGSQALALERLIRDYHDFGFELTGWCECDPESSKPIDEQPAVIAHNALHPDGIGKNWGDLTKIDWEQVPDFDLLTASTPCQSISSAGLQHGFVKDSGTRSSIIWNVHDCVRIKRPRYILMENVSAILSDKFFPLLHLWMVELERMGYTNFMPTPFTLQDGSTTRNGCLNSKHYGCPQNRERWFMVSILDCNEAYYFPNPFELEKRLKDVLEKSVPESCYLSQERVDGLVLSTEKEKDAGIGFEFAPKTVDSDCANTVSTNAGGRKTDNFVIEPCIAAMRGRDKDNPSIRGKSTSNFRQHLEVDSSDTSNTLTSVAKDNLLIEPAIIKDFYQDKPISVYDGEDYTLRSDRTGLKVSEPIILGWVRDTKGNIVSRPEVDIANCVTAGKRDNTQNYVLEQVIEEVRKAFSNRGILMYKGNPYFVRKLSTRELYRLMDLEENDIDTLMATDISKTSHNKLAGNSIVVSVLYHIFRTMFIDTVPLEGTQTTLF